MLSRFLYILGGLLVAIQLVPYGWNHTNPAVVAEPKWDTPRTRELFFRACADCHSNESKWPWYSRVAPVSWLVYNDVQEGREHLNISEWNRPQKDANEASEKLQKGEMPLPIYLPLPPRGAALARRQGRARRRPRGDSRHRGRRQGRQETERKRKGRDDD